MDAMGTISLVWLDNFTIVQFVTVLDLRIKDVASRSSYCRLLIRMNGVYFVYYETCTARIITSMNLLKCYTQAV